MTQHLCRVCPVYKQQPTQYRAPHVCDPCEARIARQLVQISDEWILLDAAGGDLERALGLAQFAIPTSIAREHPDMPVLDLARLDLNQQIDARSST